MKPITNGMKCIIWGLNIKFYGTRKESDVYVKNNHPINQWDSCFRVKAGVLKKILTLVIG